MTDIPLNTYIEWTEEDRKRGECPVPAGSDATLWIEDRTVTRDVFPEAYNWGECEYNITAYFVHSIPQHPREFWLIDFNVCDEKPDVEYLRNKGYTVIHVREVLE